MSICPMNSIVPRDCLSLGVSKTALQIHPQYSCLPLSLSVVHHGSRRLQHCAAAVRKPNSISNSKDDSDPNSKPKKQGRRKKPKGSEAEPDNASNPSPTTIPRKPRRGRKSEAVAVEDFVRDSLEKTFASIREQNPEVFASKEQILREGRDKTLSDDSAEEDDESDDDGQEKKQMVVDEDDPTWPVDAEVGWGTRASDYFEKHPIKNVVGDDGAEIDWEGEVDDSWIQEINCLEWESFAFHPSPLIVLVFERYNRAADNWKLLKELEKAFKVYWNAKDRLPPRAVKLDINIEKDLAYALKVRQGPQILFLRGQKILYRECEMRTSDELVQMIAFFYYNSKRPSWVNEAALTP
ncbi:Thioredoxin-like fold domain-containing protein MRL7 chloroplastic [Bienertia sinuspersici]